RPLELHGEEPGSVGADAEEGGVAERELAGVAQQEIQAEREDREDAGHDQGVQVVRVPHPRGRRRDYQQAEPAGNRAHPTRSARAKSPDGRSRSTATIMRNPTASR